MVSLATHQIKLVQASFEKIIPVGDATFDLFYARLFELDPSLRLLFSTNMADQKKKLMHMLRVTLRGLANPDVFIPTVQELGARHVGYGVTDAHYAIVGDALLWALEHGLGDDFTPEVKAAWTTVYAVLAETAIAGAHQVLLDMTV